MYAGGLRRRNPCTQNTHTASIIGSIPIQNKAAVKIKNCCPRTVHKKRPRGFNLEQNAAVKTQTLKKKKDGSKHTSQNKQV